MQKRLRPVYPGRGATDFAMELRDRHQLDPPPGKWFKLDADEFGIYLQTAFTARRHNSSMPAGKVDARACRRADSVFVAEAVATVELR
jgi:hypothetical protein